MQKLSDKTFSEIIQYTPLIAIDLIIQNSKSQVLLGKRLNRPAQGFWFIPGGRIRKNETFADAFKRISSNEVSLNMCIEDSTHYGVYEHFYKDSVFDNHVSTHYVVIARHIQLQDKDSQRIQHDLQHSDLKWWDIETLLKDPAVHGYTKDYFS